MIENLFNETLIKFLLLVTLISAEPSPSTLISTSQGVFTHFLLN